MADEILTCEDLRCQACGWDLLFVKSHYQCDNQVCPLKGQNQVPCCQP